jgi:putative nucleotidyltransferase with HDIG domain
MDAEISRKVLVVVIGGPEKQRADIARALMSFYVVQSYADTPQALDALAHTVPAIILIDDEAQPSGGFKTLLQLMRLPNLAGVPFIGISGRPLSDMLDFIERQNLGGALAKPFLRSRLLSTISGLINRSVEQGWEKIEPVQQAALKNTVDLFNNISDLMDTGDPIQFNEVKDSCKPLAEAIQSAKFRDILSGVKGHDNYSYVHSLRVATFLSLFGTTIGMKGDELLLLASGGMLHDIGKMAIPHDVLNKPGRLTEEEFAVMKSHVKWSAEILAAGDDVAKGAIVIAEQHHEKLDGTGYPKGIAGRDLNELARMASIVDIFGALTDRRVYKDPMSPEKALGVMSEMKTAIDLKLLGLFRELLLDAASDAPRPANPPPAVAMAM